MNIANQKPGDGNGIGSQFASLLNPISVEEFSREYREKRPLLIQPDKADKFVNLLTLSDIDHILASLPLQQKDLRMARSGEVVPPANYVTESGEIDIDAVYAEFGAGATIILEQLQRRWQPLRSFCADLQDFFEGYVQANVYVTPQNSQGFDIHYDTHDVIVVQVYGEKFWEVFDSPLTLPLISQPHNKLQHTLPEPSSFILSSGDVLYLPRGWYHRASTLDRPSIHITVGIFPPMWRELFLEIVRSAAEANENFRASLPFSLLNPEEFDGHIESGHFKQMIAALSEPEVINQALSTMKKRFEAARTPLFSGQLQAMQSLDLVHKNTVVRHRPGYIGSVLRENGNVILRFGQRSVLLPAEFEPELRYIADTKRFVVQAIPDTMEDDSKILLVRRLIHEGFLLPESEQ